MTGRFVAPQLLQLGPPPRLAAIDYEAALLTLKAKIVVDMNGAGIPYDVQMLETDPAVIEGEADLVRDMQRRAEIDDAVAGTFLGSAVGPMLDHRAADYGVVRRVILVADPVAGTPDVYEDDDSLRLRAQLAWEAQSTAGPAGSYIFHAIDAHPDVLDAVAYGPESGHVGAGEVLVLVQSRSLSGIPSTGIVDAVADRLDAAEIRYSNGVTVMRAIDPNASVRTLCARVTVQAPQPHAFEVAATLWVTPGTDVAAIETAAQERLAAYLESRRRIGREVPRSGLIAALHLTDPSGVPVIDEVTLSQPSIDVEPAFDRLATVGTITLTAQVR